MSRQESEKNRILLVEDEESLAVGLQYNLQEEGYDVEWVADGRTALEKISSGRYDLIVLDIMLPYVDGFEVAEKTRQLFPRIPILILTARTAAQDRVKGLQIGADDYLVKPFHLQELLLRVKGMLKRQNWYEKDSSIAAVYRCGDIEIDFEQLTGRAGDRQFDMTVREAMMLKYLIEHKGTIVSRRELLENVWGISSEIETRTVDNFIVRLRKYIEKDPANPVIIQSVRGAGYRFVE